MDRTELCERYLSGPSRLAAVVASLSAADLDRHPADGEWSARQVIHHLADAELTASVRLRRLLAEERPLIAAYDEAEYARRLNYEVRAVDLSLTLIGAARAANGAILERLTDDDWKRAGTHSDSGYYSVEIWLTGSADHCDDHIRQIGALRAPD